MTEALTISPQRPDDISMDYDRLRAEGIEHLEQLAAQIWTDFNAHDPGITILEVLCYAITDLGYRANLPIEDILATGGNKTEQVFFDRQEVLPSGPYTSKDYRKLFIDVPGVKNAWVYKYYRPEEVDPTLPAESPEVLNGLYQVLLELPDGLNPDSKEAKSIVERVQRHYYDHRNLGEDLQKISVVRDCPFCLCVDLELEMEGNPQEILAAAMFAIKEYCAPHPQFHSFQEMLEKGVQCEDILDGPLLQHGFLPDSELEQSPLRTVLYRSDVIRILMETEGVKAVNSLAWKKAREKGFNTNWCLDFKTCAVGPSFGTCEGFYQPFLDLCCSKMRVKRGAIATFYSDKELEEALGVLELGRDMPVDRTIPNLTGGQYRPDLGDYKSVQFEFPENYAVGDYDLRNDATQLRRAQQKQLQAYLAFFDQALAGYLKQLAKVRDLLSVNQHPDEATYVYDALLEVPGMGELMAHNEEDYKAALRELTETGTQRELRRNRIMDHLLARFGEQFTEHSLQLFASQVAREDDANTTSFDAYLRDKSTFLKELPTLSGERGKAYNYKANPVWNSDNVAGLKKRAARLLGLENYAASSVFCDPEYILNVRPVPGGDGKAVQLQFSRREDKTVLLTSPSFSGRGRAAKAKRLRSIIYFHLSNPELFEVQETGGQWQVVFNKNLPDQDATRGITPPYLFSPAFNSEELAERWLSDILQIIQASAQEKENFHLLEHILLRPNDPDDKLLSLMKPNPLEDVGDYYSFIVSVMLPGWTKHFKDQNYRRFVEQTIRREAPAHIYLRFCWLDQDPMRAFEDLYKNWREAIMDCSPDRECNINEKANKLILWLNELACPSSPTIDDASKDICAPAQKDNGGGSLS